MGISVRDYYDYVDPNWKTHLQWVAPFPIQGMLGSVRVGESELSTIMHL